MSRCRQTLNAWEKLLDEDSAQWLIHECESGKRYSRVDIELLSSEICDQFRAKHRDLTGKRVTFCLKNSAEWLASFIAVLRLEAIAIPLDPGLPDPQQQETARSVGAALHRNADGVINLKSAPPAEDRYILGKLTSGTTGAPNLILFEESQMIADAKQICRSMRIQSSDTNYATIPFSHSYGLGNLVFPAILNGTPIACGSLPFPQIIAQDIKSTRATVFPSIPSLIRALTQSDLSANSLESLRLVISAGSPIPAAVAQRFYERFNRTVHAFYGSSETGGICFDCDGTPTRTEDGNVGTPIDGVDIKISNDHHIKVSSKAVAPQQVSESDSRNAFKLSDLGHFNSNGTLTITGRSRGFAKVGSKRIDISCLEKAIQSQDGINDAYLHVEHNHDRLDDTLTAFVVSSKTSKAIRDTFKKSHPQLQIPNRFLIVDEIPQTARGKVDTKKLLIKRIRLGTSHTPR